VVRLLPVFKRYEMEAVLLTMHREMIGSANMFADLPVPGGEKQHADLTGKKWDLRLPGMFHFEYVKDSSAKHDGILLKSTKVYSDSGPAVVEMLKRGMVKPEQLLG
jgi:hypothetical protein